jgi:N-acetyl-alpha-D-muramate 1-phosphate uridylyltransferase
MMQVVILAGGLGTRLHPTTHKIPKSLVEIAGEPFISHQLRLLKRQGVEDVVICTGYLNYMIMDFVRYGQKWGIYITYSHDGGELLGTGGAIKKALPFLENNFFVLYGDSYLDCDLYIIEQAYIDSGKFGLMTVFKNCNKWDKSNVVYNNGIIERFDTGDNVEYIDWGLGILSKEVFAKYQHKPLSLSMVYNDLLNINQLAAFEVHNRFYEIGSVCGILDTEQYISRK